MFYIEMTVSYRVNGSGDHRRIEQVEDEMKYVRWIALLLCLATCLNNVRHSWRDNQQFGGTDLRVRVVGARAMLRGINPYSLKNSRELDEELQDPDQTILNRCTYPPTLLLFYAPLANLDYRLQRALWMVLEWTALALSVTLLSLAIRSRDVRFWFVIGSIGLIGGSHFWRLHVERGQYYVFVLLLLSLGTHFTLRRWLPIVAGIFFGLAACLRPPVVLLIAALWWTRSRSASYSAVITLGLAILLSTLWGGLDYWRDFVELSRSWELAILGQSFGDVPELDLTSTIDGYRRPMLDDFTPNLSLASFARGMLPTEQRLNPKLLATIIKVCWLVVVSSLVVYCCRGHWFKTVSERYALLLGAAVMLLTDYFLPIRIEYADVLFCLPLVLLTPMLLRKRHIILATTLVAAFLLSAVPRADLPSQFGAITTALRSAVVMYLTIRFVVLVADDRNRPTNSIHSRS